MTYRVEHLKIYGGGLLASVFNMAMMNDLAVFLQIALTIVTIWYTIKKGRKK